MKAYDFEYDNLSLSSFGYTLCNFGSKGLQTISNGSMITFNTVSTLNGAKHELTSVEYENCLETVLQICKNPCGTDDFEMTIDELRILSRWLNRKGFYKLKFLDEEYIDLYYEASIVSIGRIELNGKLCGLELNIVTNSPFPRKEPRIININNTVVNGKHSINDTSHEEGYIYPYTEITIGDIGDGEKTLVITNAIENRKTVIENCVSNEVITMDYPVITSTLQSHNIQNDFNWNFFRVANTYENSRNDLTISLPCSIKIKYSPIVKVGL